MSELRRYAMRGNQFDSSPRFMGTTRRLTIPRDELVHHFDEGVGMRLMLADERDPSRLEDLRAFAREIERRVDAQPAWKKGGIVFARGDST